jgi:parvulin-like peptidyl-prolyl isomerase
MSTTTSQTGENRMLAEQVYNMLMIKIDRDLLLENIPTLDSKYKGESEEQREERMERYKESYTKFDQEMETFMNSIHERSRVSKRTALQQKEKVTQKEEASEIENLELSFQ